MKAVQLVGWQTPAEFRDVPMPEPGPGQVLIEVAGAGVCHSDLHLMDWPAGQLPFELPFTLGHETSGWVHTLGGGVSGLEPGEPVIVYGSWGCGRCHACARGAENYCHHAAEISGAGGGLGRDGGMAEYMLVPSDRFLVPLGDLDPRTSAPLADAALTPYHAIKRSLNRLTPGTTAVVLGVGGLGHSAVHLLTALAPADVIAVDVSSEKLELARKAGAAQVVHSDAGAAAAIRELTHGRGAALTVDCVGSDDTMALAAAIAAAESDIAVVGLAGGTLPMRFGSTAWEAAVTMPYWGTRPELIEVIALARAGRIRPHVETFPLVEALRVYQQLRDGRIQGRAVLLPHG